MKDKLRLDYFLSVGGKLTKGDECYNIEYKEPNAFKEVVQKGDAFAGQLRFSGEGYGIYGKGDLKHLVITSFTDRENKGVQPVPDDFPVVATLRCGDERYWKSCDLSWSIYMHQGDIITWKPDYEALLKMQAEYDLNNFKDTMNHKQKVFKRTPIYTQEMKDNGESPKIGMRCLDRKGNEVVFLGEHKAEAWLESVSNTIDWNTHCDAVKNLKPIKTPEQIKLEEAKKKQLEDMCFKYKNLPLEVAMQMQKNGDFPEIVLDDLNARGMAKQ